MQTLLLFLAGGVILALGTMLVYAVAAGRRRTGAERSRSIRPGHQCMYCRSTNTRRLSQEPRYDDHGFALITAYECVRCGLPFWSVHRTRQQQHSH